ncbi:MAG: EamA family transporter RarD [Acidimicrobiia bacterium]|nr:EamA family transporter RarD [Acidimicrobiia bacterium]
MLMNRGAVLGVAAYLLWGLSPIFWRIEPEVSLFDVILWRSAAAAVLLIVWQITRGSLSRLRTLVAKPRDFSKFLFTALLLGTNWIVFILVVTTDRVLEASLGYFINPLMSVLLGVVVLRERLRRASLFTVFLAACGVLVLALDVGSVPWNALYLAGSFALYGLFRKLSSVGTMDGLTIEMLMLFPVVLGLIVYRAVVGEGVFGLHDLGLDIWLIGAGAMTIAPLLLFSAAARLMELWIVGMMQFLAPTLQFVLAVWLWNEPWSGGVAVGFVLIWVALAIFVAETFHQIRRTRHLAKLSAS